VTVLEATDVVFVDFTLPQQRLGDVTLGMPVRIQPETKSEVVDGTVSAVDSQLDAATRSIKIRASVPNKGDTLRPGMFANVSLVLPKQNAAVTVPATAIIHNSYGDSVFVVKDGKAQQQFVKVDRTRGDFVALSDGLAEGDTVVSAGAFKLRNGAKVVVDDKVKLDPKLDPKPENR